MQLNYINKNLLRWFLPVAIVVLGVLLLHIVFSQKADPIQEIAPENGILDIRNVDVSSGVINIVNNWDFYPSELYTSQDFAAGTVGEKSRPEESASDTPYGTHRLRILAQPNQYYTICSFSLDYASRVFVNGSEVATFGTVADNAADFVPKVGYMTIPMYSGENGEIEIIYQYGNYVHKNGGYIQPTYLSTPQIMERFKAANDLVSLSVSGGLLLLMLYFLLSAAVRRKADFLCLALCCLVMALRDQNFLNIHLLPADTSWYFVYRTLILIVMLMPVSILLLLKCMYDKATRRWPLYVYLGMTAIAAMLICVLPTQDLVSVSTAVYYASIPYLLYLLFGVARQGRLQPAVRNKQRRTVGVTPFDLIFDRKTLAREVVNLEGELRKTRARVDAGVLHFDHARHELVVIVHGDARSDFRGESRNGFGRAGLTHRLLRAAGQNQRGSGGDQREFFHDGFSLKPSCRIVSSAGFPSRGIRERTTSLPFPALRL